MIDEKMPEERDVEHNEQDSLESAEEFVQEDRSDDDVDTKENRADGERLPDDVKDKPSEESLSPQSAPQSDAPVNGDEILDDLPSDKMDAEAEKEVFPFSSRHPTGDPESTGGWWAGVPFTPIENLELEDLDDEETQPLTLTSEVEAEIQIKAEDDQLETDAQTRSSMVKSDQDSEQDTRPVPTQPKIEAEEAEGATQPISPEQGPQRASDDIPTVPPPNVPTDWTPEKANLPKAVSEVDRQATRVTPSAYHVSRHDVEQEDPFETKPVESLQKKGRRPSELKRPKKPNSKKKSPGCFLKVILALGFLIVLAALVAGSIGIYQYFRISSTLPDVNELREHAAKFETTRILDRDGNILYEILDPNAGRRTYIPLEKISPEMIAATIATEDKDFFTNPGFDLFGMIRALWQNYTAGEIRSGASTITQQLARALLMDPTERYEQSYERKAREIVLSYEITRQYSKEEILELYLNENFYGNMAYGVQAAAETYFHTSAESLNLWQASFLAGLPQGPSIYDIYNNRDATLYRQRSVLVLMYEMSSERDCIDVATNRPPVCVSYTAATQAGIDLANYNFPEPEFNMRYPHWVVYIKTLLEEQFDPQTIYRSGFTVHTTLDPDLQKEAQRIVANQVDALAGNNASNGALIAIDPNTSEILTMVGSADFYSEAIDGQVNMVLSQTRQPGSAIKPLTYVAAFEKGWTPATLIWDVPTEFPPSTDPFDTNPPYKPVNYDGKFHGPVSVRSALANSYNIPAVKALEFVGIYDNPDTPGQEGLITFAQRMGITSLTRSDYGLSLSLGGGEISLKELTAAYGTFANQGRKRPTVAISKIVDRSGNVIYDYEQPVGDQVVRVEHAYLISSILADTNARIPMFGTNPVINLAFPAAVKTGTTNDFRDNWTIGYTPDLVVGAWVGNTDYSPMIDTTGLTGAGPIWAEFMTYAINELTGGRPSPFVRPPGIVDRVVCSVSGTEPSEWCPEQRSEIFAADQPPKPKSEDLWQKVTVDTWTGLAVSDACQDYTDQKSAINVDDKWARQWLKNDPNGRKWAEDLGFSSPMFFAPDRACRADDPRPIITLTGISEGQTITTNPLRIRGMVTATENFDYYRIEWGRGATPLTWEVLVDNEATPQETPDTLYEWDLEDLEPGVITLKIYVHSTEGTYAEKLINLNIQLPTPTPTSTPTQTMTPTPTSTPTMTPTEIPTSTPTTVPTEASTPTGTPTPSSTPDEE